LGGERKGKIKNDSEPNPAESNERLYVGKSLGGGNGGLGRRETKRGKSILK